LQRRGHRLVILLDEFDVLVYNEQIPRELFSIFRSMAASYCVSFVVASREGSIDHLAEDTKTGSAFLNIFGIVYVGPFQEDEAKDLIRMPSARRGVFFTDEEEKLILKLAGFFPFFLQIACYHMFKLKRAEVPLEEARQQLEKNFTFEAKPHFEYMITRMQNYEQEALRFWIRNRYMEDESARDSLLEKGILIQSQGRTRIFSEVFERLFMSPSPLNQFIATVGNIIRGRSS
ncbi:MAG TPA: hypothetical protein VJT09_00975, partial [Pyrinomonadaceae bacterium]|nr:hypothetical protein [Pyrinomonadaceae bacterium]